VLRGRGGDEIARAAGSGVLGEGARTAKAQHCQDIAKGTLAAQGIAGADVQETGTRLLLPEARLLQVVLQRTVRLRGLAGE
jgi:hypothetical protein